VRRLLLLIIALCTASVAQAQQDAATREREAVRRAALDYIEGFYEGDTAKIIRSLHPRLAKDGFWKEKDSTTYAPSAMSYDQAVAYARRIKSNGKPAPADAPREVAVFEVLDQIASARVRAWWGVDYLLLAKYNGQWMIKQVLWAGPVQ
jgi:hypothetical protein